MVKTRQAKIDGIANFIPEQTVEGPEEGDLLVLSWGGTYGSTLTAVRECQHNGKSVALAHLRYMNPMPRNLGKVISRYKKVLIPELNAGQLRLLIRSYFLVDAVGYNKIKGKPFLVSELVAKIDEVLASCQDT